MQDEQYPEHISPSNHQTTTTTRQEDNIRVDEDHELAQIEDAVIDALGRIHIVHLRGLAYGYVAALESLHAFLDRLYDGKQYQYQHHPSPLRNNSHNHDRHHSTANTTLLLLDSIPNAFEPMDRMLESLPNGAGLSGRNES